MAKTLHIVVPTKMITKKNATDFFKALLAQCGYENVNVCFKGDESKN